MNETDIRKYALLMKEMDLSAMEITEDNRMVRLERNSGKASGAIPSSGEVLQPANPAPAAEPKPSGDYITSPLVGVFYAAPAENAQPYVSKGDTVKKGQVLCIVEAMKMLNEIVAEEDGVINDICVTNGQVVEFGTPLFCIGR